VRITAQPSAAAANYKLKNSCSSLDMWFPAVPAVPAIRAPRALFFENRAFCHRNKDSIALHNPSQKDLLSLLQDCVDAKKYIKITILPVILVQFNFSFLTLHRPVLREIAKRSLTFRPLLDLCFAKVYAVAFLDVLLVDFARVKLNSPYTSGTSSMLRPCGIRIRCIAVR